MASHCFISERVWLSSCFLNAVGSNICSLERRRAPSVNTFPTTKRNDRLTSFSLRGSQANIACNPELLIKPLQFLKKRRSGLSPRHVMTCAERQKTSRRTAADPTSVSSRTLHPSCYASNNGVQVPAHVPKETNARESVDVSPPSLDYSNASQSVLAVIQSAVVGVSLAAILASTSPAEAHTIGTSLVRSPLQLYDTTSSLERESSMASAPRPFNSERFHSETLLAAVSQNLRSSILPAPTVSADPQHDSSSTRASASQVAIPNPAISFEAFEAQIPSSFNHLSSPPPLQLLSPTTGPDQQTMPNPTATLAEAAAGAEAGAIARPAECAPADGAADGGGGVAEVASLDPSDVANDTLVMEAWEVVNDAFLDARQHQWTPEAWMEKRKELQKRPPHSRMAAYSQIATMMQSLGDPYSRFLTPSQFAQLAKYDVTGIGLNIGEVAAENVGGAPRLKVLGLVLGSPAQQAGVRQGDELVTVNGTRVEGLSAFEVSSLIQGPKGTPVTIQVMRNGCLPAGPFTMARGSDVQTPVSYRLERAAAPGDSAEGEVGAASPPQSRAHGYIRLSEFNALAKKDLVIAMERLQAAGAKSFTLDLQDNPGGLVQAGVEIARLFLDKGATIVYTEGRDLVAAKSALATSPAFSRAPLTVLVNDRTASASEIVAAALHDNCRAILVGHRTFGKGLIQTVYELSDGSGMILTVGKYVTPAHSDIDGNGIEPDFRRNPGPSAAERKLASCTVPVADSALRTSPLS